MNKKFTIELTDEEYDALVKTYEAAKVSNFMPTKAANVDEFLKEIVITFVKGPSLESLKNLDPNELFNGIGSLEEIKDLLGGIANKSKAKPEEKKDEIPDDKKYKS